jgi:hypothetical protein
MFTSNVGAYLIEGRHDIQNNDAPHNDTQHKGQICNTKTFSMKGTQHNKSAIMLSVFILSVAIFCYAECRGAV